MTNPVLHVPAHKQTDPAKRPGQIVTEVANSRVAGMLPALAAPYGNERTSLHSKDASSLRNVWVQAVKQDKEQAK